MTTTHKECNHCGIEYYYYMSGSNIPYYNSDSYCEDCEKVRREAVEEAFSKVPIKFKWEYIETDMFSLDDLLLIEKERENKQQEDWQKRVDAGEILFPLAKRVYSNLYSTIDKEFSRSGVVKVFGKSYSYLYWSSKPEKAKIKVNTRIKYEKE